jgi:hypothetical protein
MKGYFSQLARHTGFTLGVGGVTSAISPSGSRTPPARPAGHDEVSPLHLDEVTFTSPSQSAADTSERTTEGIVGHPSLAPISEQGSETISEGPAGSRQVRTSELTEPPAENEPKTQMEFSPGFSFEESITSESRASASHAFPDAEDSGGQITSVISEEYFSTAQTLDLEQPSERVAAFEDRYATTEYQPAAPLDQDQPPRPMEAEVQRSMQATEPDERRDTGSEVETDRHVILRNYLKEVRDWIAAPPAMEETEIEFLTAAETPPRSRNPAGLERGATAAAPAPRHDLEEPKLQDLSLSIGTISIVIEEPRKEVLIQQAPPANPERVLDRTTNESTDLSRYYLRSW